MSKIVVIKIENFPKRCCDSREKYHKSTSSGYTGTLNGVFSPPKYRLSTCIHLLS